MDACAQLNENKWIIAASAGLSLLLALLYTTLLRFFAKPLTFAIMAALWFLLAASTVILCVKAGFIDPKNVPISEGNIPLPEGTSWGPAQANLEMVIAAAVIVGLCFLVYTVMAIFMIPRVSLACDVIGLATECLTECPSFMVFPITQWVATVFLFIWCVYVMIYLAGSGTWNPETRTFDWNEELRYTMLYHFFGLLWGRAFILAMGNMIIACGTCDVPPSSWLLSPVFAVPSALQKGAGRVLSSGERVAVGRGRIERCWGVTNGGGGTVVPQARRRPRPGRRRGLVPAAERRQGRA